MAIKTIQDIEKNKVKFTELRHEFHQHPELAFAALMQASMSI